MKKPIIPILILTTLFATALIANATLPPLSPPPVGGYDSGSNSILDPGCAPNTPNCWVNLPSGGSVTPTNGLSTIGSNIGLGGTLIQNTIINQNGNDFSITNNGTTFASGADPLNLLPLFGQAFPGIGISTDGATTGGLRQWISAINDGSDPITVVGNFDFANNIQAGLVVEGLDTELSSSDGVSGSSNVSVRPGRLSLSSSDGIDIYSNNYLRFNNFNSSRDDSGTNFPTNFLYTDGSGNLQSAPTSLLGGGSFSLASQDEGSTLTSTTTGYNFIGAGVTATESGGLVTVNIPGGGGGGADGSIYLNDGALTGNRTLNGGGNDLTFNNLNNFLLVSNNKFGIADVNTTGFGESIIDGVGSEHSIPSLSGVSMSSENDTLDNKVTINATAGRTGFVGANNKVTFDFINSGVQSRYAFPNTDGLINQVLTTDGAGQLSWQNAGGGGTNIYNSDGTLTGNRILNGGGNDLMFTNLNSFNINAGNNLVAFDTSGISLQTATSGNNLILNTAAVVTSDLILQVNPFFPNTNRLLIQGLITDNTADQVLAKDSTGKSVWRDVGSLSGGGGTNIYNSNGTLTGNRTLNGGGNSLTFNNLNNFALQTSLSGLGTAAGIGIAHSDNGSNISVGGSYLNGSGDFISSTFYTGGQSFGYGSGIRTINAITNKTASIITNPDDGISFIFTNPASGGYRFPRTDGLANQVLTTDGAGQLSWQTTGANRWSLTGNSGTTAGTNFIGTTDPEDFVIKVNNIESGRFTNSTEFNQYSVFLGHNAGVGASSAHRSNLFGRDSGGNAINASGSNFLGELSGYEAINASASNFIGAQSGRYATNANHSNFFGDSAGYSASEANNSIFIGRSAGSSANFASNSIFLGQQAGMSDIVNNTGNPDDFSILLGNNTSTGGFSNSIAIGGSALNTSSNQFMIGSTTRPIDETKIIGSLGTECTITTGTGMACTSDERLKTNITDLNSDILSKLQNVRTVSYNWLQNPNSPLQIGFLAQNLEQQFPELVITDATGKKQVYYSQMTPILVAAVKELNLKLSTLELAQGSTSTNIFDSLKVWFGDTGNGIIEFVATRLRAREELCINNTCIDESELQQFKTWQQVGSPVPVTPVTTDPVLPQEDPAETVSVSESNSSGITDGANTQTGSESGTPTSETSSPL